MQTTHFHMKSFALSLAFIVRLKITRKWPVDKPLGGVGSFDRLFPYRRCFIGYNPFFFSLFKSRLLPFLSDLRRYSTNSTDDNWTRADRKGQDDNNVGKKKKNKKKKNERYNSVYLKDVFMKCVFVRTLSNV